MLAEIESEIQRAKILSSNVPGAPENRKNGSIEYMRSLERIHLMLKHGKCDPRTTGIEEQMVKRLVNHLGL